MKVTAVYTHERQPDGSVAWVVELAEEARCHTFGRTLRAARHNIHEAAAAWYETGLDDIDVEDDVQLPADARQAVATSRTLRDQERAIREQARHATVEAVSRLRQAGLSERDQATLLGISHQRVHQLASGR